ncbi:S-adenosyl-L-methionine-dependent methyltransferase [Rhypophila decipiens]|uniref:S-adenosyl-L-methionine-dependent methyltransferase n=1 Tax=Rhypophila decipiens TaxID=261697 RepID=A0AAN6Y3Y3_9PEZI|nr:S-adenosyl-L-methionine-dependent methyltransferase [Rhypophila decipiens]
MAADLESSKKQYDTFAPIYLSVDQLPASKVETELVLTALGDCTGLHILDLGGGTGLHAREAVQFANAAQVDVVDISREMLINGSQSLSKEFPEQASKVRWFEADLSKSLDEQPVPCLDGTSKLRTEEGYDIVMANWLFDHATSYEALKGMYGNVARYLKPHGGRFVNVRVFNLRAKFITNGNGKYGAYFKDIERIEGEPGYKYECGMQLDPTGKAEPFYFGASSMDETLELRDGEEGGLGRQLGLSQYWVVPPEETKTFKGDEEYWREFVEEPNLRVVVARKE